MVARPNPNAVRPRNGTDDDEERVSLLVDHSASNGGGGGGRPPRTPYRKGKRPLPKSEEHRPFLQSYDAEHTTKPTSTFIPSSSSSAASSTSGGGMRRRRTTSGSRRGTRRPPKSKAGRLADQFFGANWNVTRLLGYVMMSFFMGIITFWVLKVEHQQLGRLNWNDTIVLQPNSKERKCFNLKHGDKRCTCPNPSVPANNNQDPKWKSHHQRLRDTARKAQNSKLDIVMLGGDAVERWNGTSGLGMNKYPSMNTLFDKYFQKSTPGAKYDALALGATGDVGPNLLWLIRRGEVEKLNPKVWFIHIGTTDLFDSKCTNRYVVANVLNVVQELHSKKPDAQFIIHGILPRLDPEQVYSKGNDQLGEYWHRAQRVNKLLKNLCETGENLWYMQSGNHFLKIDYSQKGRNPVDPRLFDKDGDLTAPGMKIWGAEIVNKTGIVLAAVQKREAEAKAKAAAP